jgi:riboflavin kinase/FMN adenylyltransferase
MLYLYPFKIFVKPIFGRERIIMQIFDSLEEINKPFHNAVITIGNFDGVHIGHQALLHETIEKAGELQGTSIVMTFEPHPLRVLKRRHPPLITMIEQKIELIQRLRHRCPDPSFLFTRSLPI